MTIEEVDELRAEYPADCYEGYSIKFETMDNVLNPLVKDSGDPDKMIMVWITPINNIKAMVYKASYEKELLANFVEEYFKNKE